MLPPCPVRRRNLACHDHPIEPPDFALRPQFSRRSLFKVLKELEAGDAAIAAEDDEAVLVVHDEQRIIHRSDTDDVGGKILYLNIVQEK